MRPIDRQAVLRFLAVATVSLGAATIAIAVLQDGFGVPNPSALYLVAVVATAIASGTWGAVLTAVASFVLYNFLFIDPRYTLTVAQPRELVNLLVLLFVGIVVGQLAALQRARAVDALAREAPPADEARQRLPARTNGGRPRQVLHRGQPHCPAGARASPGRAAS
jgi:two-component system sensor histidine kinase KdpD